MRDGPHILVANDFSGSDPVWVPAKWLSLTPRIGRSSRQVLCFHRGMVFDVGPRLYQTQVSLYPFSGQEYR